MESVTNTRRESALTILTLFALVPTQIFLNAFVGVQSVEKKERQNNA
jgi:hypothetical protein